jgi:hypothetical protein
LQLAQNIQILLTFYIIFIKFHGSHMKKLISGLIGLCLVSSAQAGMFGSFAAKNPGFDARKQQNILTPHHAKAFSYSFLEAGWAGLNGPDDFDLNGYTISGSYEVMDNVFIAGNVTQGSGDHLDSTQYSFGVGAYLPITDTVDWVTQVGYGKSTIGVHGRDFDANGLVGSSLIRWQIADRFEAQGGVAFSYLENDIEANAVANVLIGLTSDIKLVAGGSYNSDYLSYGASLRKEFR